MNGSKRPTAVGSPAPRRSLDRFVSGRGRYVADVHLRGALHVKVLRSTVPHADILSIDASSARALPGVAAVITGADMEAFRPQPSLWVLPGQNHSNLKALATDRVRWVGQPYAVIAAIDADSAEAAAEAIRLDLRPLPHHSSPAQAMAPDAVRLYDHWSDNVVARADWSVGDVDTLLAQAAYRVSDRFTTQRVHALSIEPRGVLAQPEGDGVTVWSSTQAINQVRASISECLDLPQSRVRVIAHDVGGAFGMKFFSYAEETLLAYLALKLQRPVRWIESRRESFVASVSARATYIDLDVGFDAEGRILALRGEVVLDKGGDPHATSIGTGWIAGAVLTGPYRVPAVDIQVCGAVTNTAPTGAYRGFGQPEANFALERALDMAASGLGIDPADIRRRNLVKPEEMPFSVYSGVVLDSGRYGDLLDATLSRFGYLEAKQRAAETSTATKARGIGIACYSELSNLGPSAMMKAIGVDAGFDISIVRMDPGGHVEIFTSMISMGQGIETSLTQVCADVLSIPVDHITVVNGDTQSAPYTGYSSSASRGAGVGGMAVTLASQRLAERLCTWGAHLLGASRESVRLVECGVEVCNDPTRRVSIATIAEQAYRSFTSPPGIEPGLEGRAAYDPPAMAVTYGSIAAEVSVDLELGKVKVERITFGHDCGVVINPPIVDGQVRGGVAQALGGALFEEIRYDEDAQASTLSLHDYLLPLASDVPNIDLLHFETPTPYTPIGVKGVGETGIIAVPAAIANAVKNALGDTASELNTLPLRPETVLAAFESG